MKCTILRKQGDERHGQQSQGAPSHEFFAASVIAFSWEPIVRFIGGRADPSCHAFERELAAFSQWRYAVAEHES